MEKYYFFLCILCVYLCTECELMYAYQFGHGKGSPADKVVVSTLGTPQVDRSWSICKLKEKKGKNYNPQCSVAPGFMQYWRVSGTNASSSLGWGEGVGRLKGQLACSNQLGIWARAMTLFCCQFFAHISPSHSQRELRIKHHIYDRAVCGFIPLQRFYTIQNVIQSSATRFFNAFTTKYKQNCHSVILGIILMLLSSQF